MKPSVMEVTEADLTTGAGQEVSPLDAAHTTALSLMDLTYQALVELTKLRSDGKLSTSRVFGVTREMRELLKVMSIYR